MGFKKLLLAILVSLAIIIVLPVYGAEKLYKIAVLPFDDGSIHGEWNWDVGKGVADEMVTALLNTKRFRLIEREQVDKVLSEQDFSAGNRVDARSAAKIGKILGVQFLVIGRVTEFTSSTKGANLQHSSLNLGLGVKSTKSSVAIDARLVNTDSAEIITSVTGKGSKSSGSLSVQKDWNSIAFGSDEFRKTDLGIALRDAVNSVAKQLADKAYSGDNPAVQPGKISGVVAFAKGDKVVLNIGSGEGVTTGMVFVVNHLLEEIKDPNTGEVIDEQTEAVAEIKATEVKEKSTTCIVVKKLSKDYDITVSDKAEQK